jgi:accessory gene regulator protein AgrB
MNTSNKRAILFLCGCIPVRLLFVYIAYYIAYHNTSFLPYLAIPAMIVAIGFISIFMFGLRKTGAETFGQPIWWDRLRPIHALFYLLFSIFAFMGKKEAYIFLAMDVLFGFISYLTLRVL